MARMVIAINNLNDAGYLPRCIRAVQAQTCRDFQLLGIDAGSTDNSREVFSEFGVPLVDCAGLNQAASVNKVLGLTDSEFFAWINPDDSHSHCFAAKHLEAFDADPELAIGYSDVLLCWEPARRPPQVCRPGDPQRITDGFRRGVNLIWHPTTAIRRSLFDAIGPFDESVVYPFDFEFWLRTWTSGHKFGYLPVATASYTSRPDNLTATKRDEIIEEVRALQRRYSIGPWRKAE